MAGGEAMAEVSGRHPVPTFLDPDEVDQLPDPVWVSVRLPRFGGSVPQLSVRETRDGHLVLPVYSSLEQLQRLHGAADHAIEVRSTKLEWLRRFVGFHVVGLDLEVPVELRAPDWDDDETEWPFAEPMGPSVVWVPSRPLRRGDRAAQIELHRDEHGQLVFAAFSSQETLALGCGDYQPAVAINVDDVSAVAVETGADVVAFDPLLHPKARHPAPRNQPTRKDGRHGL